MVVLLGWPWVMQTKFRRCGMRLLQRLLRSTAPRYTTWRTRNRVTRLLPCNVNGRRTERSTANISESVRRAFLFMLVGMILDGFGLMMAVVCYCLKNPYASLLASSLLHINSGSNTEIPQNWQSFQESPTSPASLSTCQQYPKKSATRSMQQVKWTIRCSTCHTVSRSGVWRFGYRKKVVHDYDYQASFLFTELAALFSIIVYMAKRDERTFNRYKIRATFNLQKVLSFSFFFGWRTGIRKHVKRIGDNVHKTRKQQNNE